MRHTHDKLPDHRQEVSVDRRSLLRSTVLLGSAFAAPSTVNAAEISVETDAPLTVTLTEGPYYRPLDLIRRDITEGAIGIPLEIRFRIFDVRGRPAEGIRVDVWHCDAHGNYSGFDRKSQGTDGGTAYLRGTQIADANGVVSFLSIYPGWYRGRTTHVHFKMRSGGRTNLTSQFFLPDALSEFLYTQAPEYHRDAVRDTLNSTDRIAIEGGETVRGNVRELDTPYVAELDVRIDTTAVEVKNFRPGPPGGPRPPGFGAESFPSHGVRQGADSAVAAIGGPPGPPPPGPPPSGFPFGPPPGANLDPLKGTERIAAMLPGARRSARPRPLPPSPGRVRPDG